MFVYGCCSKSWNPFSPFGFLVDTIEWFGVPPFQEPPKKRHGHPKVYQLPRWNGMKWPQSGVARTPQLCLERCVFHLPRAHERLKIWLPRCWRKCPSSKSQEPPSASSCWCGYLLEPGFDYAQAVGFGWKTVKLHGMCEMAATYGEMVWWNDMEWMEMYGM